MVRDFRLAVGKDCMGWFCNRYGWGKDEWNATSPIQLISVIALKIDELRQEAMAAREKGVGE